MLRTYKFADKLWQYEEGEQPAGAVLVEKSAAPKETPESRAAKAPAKRRATKKASE